jgi:TatD DNase family protein
MSSRRRDSGRKVRGRTRAPPGAPCLGLVADQEVRGPAHVRGGFSNPAHYLGLMLIDSHCHLDFPDFAEDRDAVILRAKARGIGRMITISTRVERFAEIAAIAERDRDIFCTIGTHPHQAHEEPEASVAQLVGLAGHPKCVGIGEAGLDYHYDRAPRDVAARVFRTHIAAARQSGLPLVIHARDADDDIAAILKEEMGNGAFTAVLHCFTAGRALAEAGLALGLYVSFSGVVTFKNSQGLRDIARDVPLDRVLVETDAPFLAPVPNRGKRNEPAFVADTARVLAQIKGVDEGAFARATTDNVQRLFAKMPPLKLAA